jgi:hypothetical protein
MFPLYFFCFEHKLGPTEVVLSCINEICCGLYILKQNTFNFEKWDCVQHESHWAPKRWDIGEYNWNSCFCFQLSSSFTIPYQFAPFLVLNFPLDFVVPLDVEVIGLNPLFGVNASLSDQFISHALIFRPRLVVLNYHLTTNKDVCLTNHTLQTHLLSPDCRVSEVVSWSIELLQCSSCDFFSFVPNGELLHCIEIPS